VREHDRCALATALSSLELVIGQFGGLTVATAHARELRRRRGRARARRADAGRAGEARTASPPMRTSGSTPASGDRTRGALLPRPGFESVGGRSLATSVSRRSSRAGLEVAAPCGMRLPILRETRMPRCCACLAPGADQRRLRRCVG
jgi:N-acetylmuramoyl-L-alanine amidase